MFLVKLLAVFGFMVLLAGCGVRGNSIFVGGGIFFLILLMSKSK